MKMEPIKVMALDQHDYYRSALIAALKTIKNVKIIGEASHVAVLLFQLRNALPDVVFFDLDVQTMLVYQYLTIIKMNYPSVKVISLSIDNSKYHVGMAFQQGTNGYLLKNTDIVELEKSLHAVLSSWNYCDKHITAVNLPVP